MKRSTEIQIKLDAVNKEIEQLNNEISIKKSELDNLSKRLLELEGKWAKKGLQKELEESLELELLREKYELYPSIVLSVPSEKEKTIRLARETVKRIYVVDLVNLTEGYFNKDDGKSPKYCTLEMNVEESIQRLKEFENKMADSAD